MNLEEFEGIGLQVGDTILIDYEIREGKNISYSGVYHKLITNGPATRQPFVFIKRNSKDFGVEIPLSEIVSITQQ